MIMKYYVFGGESVKDEEKGIKQMMKYYHDFGLTEEQLRENNKKYNPEQMLQIVKEYLEGSMDIAVRESY